MPLPRLLPRTFLPLLVKELTEQAARKRTYVLRVLYATLLYGFFALFLSQRLRGLSVVQMLGQGNLVLQLLLVLEYAGIYLLLPAMMAGVVAGEKERDTFVLLLLTDLPPWEILLQKWLGRVIPMACFVLMGLPLMGIAYAFGGISLSWMLLGIAGLAAAILQVSSVGLMWSCICRSTAGAFVATYLTLLAMYAGPPISALLLGFHDGDEWLLLFPPYAFNDYTIDYRAPWAWLCIPGTSLFCLILARTFVVRRAMVQPRNLLLALFRYIDRRMNQANRITGGVVLFKSADRLPEDRPVAWRELTKRALSKPHYLLRIFLVLELPVLILAAFAFTLGGGSNHLAVGISFILWLLVTLVVIVQSASALASERGHQTLDVLLSTPLTGRQIVLEKTAGIRRLILVLMLPMISLALLQVWWRGRLDVYKWNSLDNSHLNAALYYALGAAAAIFIYLPLVAWFGLWVGMWSRNPGRAILLSLGLFTAWCLAPFLLTATFHGALSDLAHMLCNFLNAAAKALDPTSNANDYYRQPQLIFLFFSPAAVLIEIETDSFRPLVGLAMMFVYALHFAACLGLLVLFRTLALRRADRYLGRVPAPAHDRLDNDAPPAPARPRPGSAQA